MKNCKKSSWIKVIFCISLMFIVYSGCEPMKTEDNCVDPLIVHDAQYPASLTGLGNDAAISTMYSSHIILNVCPTEWVTINASLSSKTEEFDEKVSSIQLYWEFSDLNEHNMNFVYMTSTEANPSEYKVELKLYPLDLGYAHDRAALLSFHIYVNLYEPMNFDELFYWKQYNIDKYKLVVEGTRY